MLSSGGVIGYLLGLISCWAHLLRTEDWLPWVLPVLEASHGGSRHQIPAAALHKPCNPRMIPILRYIKCEALQAPQGC